MCFQKKQKDRRVINRDKISKGNTVGSRYKTENQNPTQRKVERKCEMSD